MGGGGGSRESIDLKKHARSLLGCGQYHEHDTSKIV